MKERLLTIMNFSHIHWIDCGYISSSNGYASQEALKKISKKIETLPASGIHFIDNGHYHYVTKL